MLDDEILKTKLKNRLDRLNINEDDKDKLVAELNYLSNLIIDSYLEHRGD